MRAILITANVILLGSLVALGLQWRPALFGFLVVVPLSMLNLRGLRRGGLSAGFQHYPVRSLACD